MVVCVVFSAASSLPGCAKSLDEELQTALLKAKILPPDIKFTCSVKGRELITTTYKVEGATEKDCKIDAVIIAKTAFQLAPELSRSVVQYYDMRIPNEYSEVTVTVGDVAAYGKGDISREQLLSALKITSVKTAAPVASGRSAAKIQSSNASTAIAGGATTKSDGDNRASYSNVGVTIKYPATWTAEYPQRGNTVVRLNIPVTSSVPSTIEMQAFASNAYKPIDAIKADPRDTFEVARDKIWLQIAPTMARKFVDLWHAEDAQAYRTFASKGDLIGYSRWKFNRRNQSSKLVSIAVPASINIGQDKSIRAVQRAYYIEEIGVGARHYCRSVAFSSGNCTVLLGVFSPEINASTANAQFEETLSSVKLSPSPGSKGSGR